MQKSLKNKPKMEQQIHQKTIQKSIEKMMQKWCQKGGHLEVGRDRAEAFLQQHIYPPTSFLIRQ